MSKCRLTYRVGLTGVNIHITSSIIAINLGLWTDELMHAVLTQIRHPKEEQPGQSFPYVQVMHITLFLVIIGMIKHVLDV